MMMQSSSLHPTTTTAPTRRFVRAIAILATVCCIIATTTLLLSKDEESSYLANFDYDQRHLQLAERYADPKTIEYRNDNDLDVAIGDADDAGDKTQQQNQLSLIEDDRQQINDPLTICGRPTKVPSTEPLTNIQKYSSCTPMDKSKPINVIMGSKGFGRTGNQILEFLHAIQLSRDHNVQLGIVNGSWAMNEITRMWMEQIKTADGSKAVGFGEWVARFESLFCVKVFAGTKKKFRKGWNYINLKPRDLFRRRSRLDVSEYADSQEYYIRTLFRHYNTGVGYASDGKPTSDMCSGIKSLFVGNTNDSVNAGESDSGKDSDDEDPSSAKYSVIHSRSFGHESGGMGTIFLRNVAIPSGSDPTAAAEMQPDYVKSILRPLGMLSHPIVFVSNGEDPHVLARLRDDPEIGPMIRVLPDSESWIGGDIMLGTMANVFIGNPASTFATLIAKARLSLGMGHNYLFRARDEVTGDWKSVCTDRCIFDQQVMNVMA